MSSASASTFYLHCGHCVIYDLCSACVIYVCTAHVHVSLAGSKARGQISDFERDCCGRPLPMTNFHLSRGEGEEKRKGGTCG